MKTPEEIKKGLECCVTRYNCHFDDEQCCYHSGGASCHYDVMKDALAYIKQLEEGIDRVYEQAKRLRQQFEAQSGTDMNVHTIDAEHVRHGRWYQKRMSVPKGKGQTYLVWACSLCHKHEKKRSDYCPNCGAKMDLEVEHE